MGLPDISTIRKAIDLYLSLAYDGSEPPEVPGLVPADGVDLREWLMSDSLERTPPDAPLEAVRSFALRLGNSAYPHMKLRLTRPENQDSYVFSVDCHDAFLKVDNGSQDCRALSDLKRHNAAVAAAINSALDDADLPTERSYLRDKIRKAGKG